MIKTNKEISVLFFKMGQVTACLNANRNDPVEREVIAGLRG